MYHGMLSQHGWSYSTETHFTALKSMGIPLFTSPISHLKFAHMRCVTSSSWSTRGNSRLNKSQTFIKRAIPSKDIPTCSDTDTSYMCRTRHFRWKGQCATEIQLLNTPHDRRCCHGHQAMTPLWCSSINTLCFPAIASTTIALDSSFNLLLISRILIDTNGNGQHHVIIGINHG